MGGGPSWEQKAAAQQQLQLGAETNAIARERNAREKQGYDLAFPFAKDRIQNGLPFADALSDYQGGIQARSAAPAKARLIKSFAGMGGLPSGAKQQALTDFEAQRAHSFDTGQLNNLILNEQAKQEGARLITGQQQVANPLGFYTAQSSALNSTMNAPLQSQGIGGLLGGIAGGAAAAAF